LRGIDRKIHRTRLAAIKAVTILAAVEAMGFLDIS